MAAYFDEQAEVGEMLDSRYDDIVSGKVKMIPGDEAEAYFLAKAAAKRSQHCLRFWYAGNYLIAYAPDQRPLWVVAVMRGHRSPMARRAMGDSLMLAAP